MGTVEKRKPTPTLIRKSIWILSEEHLNLEHHKKTELVSHAAGHNSKTGKKHYRLSGRLWADKYVATENMKLFYSCNNDPNILATIESERGQRVDSKTKYFIKTISKTTLISRTTCWRKQRMTRWRKQRMRKGFPQSLTLQKKGGTTD